MEHYLIPWVVTVFKLAIFACIACFAGALLERYLPESVKQKIVEFFKEDENGSEN